MARKKKEEIIIEKTTVEEPVAQPTVKLVTLTMGATIPVMSYGNITASYTVTADSIEEAEAVLLKRIEKLFNSYTEEARKAKVKVEVIPTITIPQEEPELVVEESARPVIEDISVEKSANVIRAEAYLHNAKTPEAKNLIKVRIKASANFTEAEKAELLAK